MVLRDGSSPLARGLHPGVVTEDAGARIIPARAGFTRSSRVRPQPSSDHPRSRGVYAGVAVLVIGDLGSSPLARGLRPGRPGRQVPGRIIPARAGFTWCRPRGRSPARDHPRSRGVYAQNLRDDLDMKGSSPLARGLRRSRDPRLHRGGIIPARAGFTSRFHGRPSHTGDHPRSRGVYQAESQRVDGYRGSSPLARGLQTRRHARPQPRGIIPARAGFTPPWGLRVSGPKDHPRSRGVSNTEP